MDIFKLIFPKRCLECGQSGKYLCEKCLRQVSSVGWQRIYGLPVFSVYRYEGVVRKAIIALKYKYATEIADELTNYVATSLKAGKLVSGACQLVPIPLHWYRQNFRGFNQAAVLGEKIGAKMCWKFIPDVLIRKKLTTSQVQLKGLARRRNIKGVFAVSPSIRVSQYPCIVLFDDVFTTGSTLKEAAKILRLAGAKKIWGLTIAM